MVCPLERLIKNTEPAVLGASAAVEFICPSSLYKGDDDLNVKSIC